VTSAIAPVTLESTASATRVIDLEREKNTLSICLLTIFWFIFNASEEMKSYEL
jgi:hypothetical protein